MEFIPHKYQDFAIDFIKNKKIAALLLSCGLGKTVITLSAINDLMFDSFDVKKVLVIAPIRVAKNTWPREILKWEHLKHLKMSVVVGRPNQRVKALNTKADIYVIGRDSVVWLVEYLGSSFDFDMVVIDELSSFKSNQSKRFKSLLLVRPMVKRIVGLTGTPASNGLEDLWAQYRILDGGKRLGRFITHFRDEFMVPDKRNGQMIYSYRLKEFAEELIYEKIDDITISMDAIDHLDMPKLITNNYKVYLDDGERKIYDTLKKELTIDVSGDITAANAASLSNKLLQLANGRIYNDDKTAVRIHTKKLEALEDLIEASNGRPVLLAYWFKHDLDAILEKLNEMKVTYDIIGTTKSIDDWNAGLLQVGIIHPASCGHGLNLQQGGNTIIWYSMIWSLELYIQTVDRLYRQGQNSSTVVVEHIVCDKTIDEDVVKALEAKDTTQKALLEAVKAELGR